MSVHDLLHKALMADPGFDPHEHARDSITNALISLVDALAYLDGNPNRAEYIDSLIELHRGVDDDPLMAACITAASWLQDARTGSEEGPTSPPAQPPARTAPAARQQRPVQSLLFT